MIYRGFTFIRPGRKSHLYAVINDPAQHDDKALIVNVTSQKMMSDTTCRLYIGDHPFIDRPTVIAYWGAELKPCSDIEAEIEEGRWEKAQVDFSTAIIDRIRAGAAKSPDFAAPMLEYL